MFTSSRIATFASVGTGMFTLAASLRSQSLKRILGKGAVPRAVRDYVPEVRSTPTPQKLKVALCQMHVTEDKNANINAARQAIQVV